MQMYIFPCANMCIRSLSCTANYDANNVTRLILSPQVTTVTVQRMCVCTHALWRTDRETLAVPSTAASYCSATLIKQCSARGISVINEVQSGLLVVAGLLVVVPGWQRQPPFLIHAPSQCFFQYSCLFVQQQSSYLSHSASTHDAAACRPFFGFLNGPQSVG